MQILQAINALIRPGQSHVHGPTDRILSQYLDDNPGNVPPEDEEEFKRWKADYDEYHRNRVIVRDWH